MRSEAQGKARSRNECEGLSCVFIGSEAIESVVRFSDARVL